MFVPCQAKNPDLFAERVRETMALFIGAERTDHSFTDVRLRAAALKKGYGGSKESERGRERKSESEREAGEGGAAVDAVVDEEERNTSTTYEAPLILEMFSNRHKSSLEGDSYV